MSCRAWGSSSGNGELCRNPDTPAVISSVNNLAFRQNWTLRKKTIEMCKTQIASRHWISWDGGMEHRSSSADRVFDDQNTHAVTLHVCHIYADQLGWFGGSMGRHIWHTWSVWGRFAQIGRSNHWPASRAFTVNPLAYRRSNSPRGSVG